MKAKTRVNQLELAAELGVTNRRVRQLSEDHVLPKPHHQDGLFDLAVCRERFELYKSGTDREWEDFCNDLEMETAAAAALFERAISDAGTAEDVRAASLAVQANGEALRFLTACKSKSQSEKDVFWMIWNREEDRALSGLLHCGMQIAGKTTIVTGDGEVLAVMPVYPDVPKAWVRKGVSRRARRAAAAGKAQ